MNKYLVFLIMLLLLVAGVSQNNAQTKESKQATSVKHDEVVYTCSMHPEVALDKPGKCPKCGMQLVAREEKKDDESQSIDVSASKEKIRQAKSLLAEAKQELTQSGKYKCCIKEPCDRCALDHQSCPCAAEVKAGKSVCPDCYAGWQQGDGVVKGVKPSKVKSSFHSHKH